MIDITIFFNKIVEWMNSIGFKITSQTTMWVIFATLITVIFFIWIVFRGLRLWYWKVDIQVNTLKSIDSRLKNVEEGFSIYPLKEENKQAGNEVLMKENQTAEEFTELDKKQEDEIRNNKVLNTGRSGRVYTEEELEIQIRE